MAVGIACIALAGGCSSKDFNREVVATVNDEKITVLELREYLGAPTGVFAFTSMAPEQKKNAVDQLIAGRLVVQEGRSMGLDNTPEYREAVRNNQVGVRINALLRKEAGEKLKLDEKEIQAEAAKIKGENAGLSDTDATDRAARAIIDRQIRKIQKDLVVTARKETGAAVDNAVLDRIGKGENLPDNAVLASAGSEKILYGDVKKTMRQMPELPMRRGTESLEVVRALIDKILDQELVLRAMTEYSRKRGVDGSEWLRTSQLNMERAVIANLLFDKFSEKDPEVTDVEVATDYEKRVQMMGEDKAKAPPLEAVKEQLREILKNQKLRGAFEEHIGELRKKGKVTIKDDVLGKV